MWYNVICEAWKTISRGCTDYFSNNFSSCYQTHTHTWQTGLPGPLLISLGLVQQLPRLRSRYSYLTK